MSVEGKMLFRFEAECAIQYWAPKMWVDMESTDHLNICICGAGRILSKRQSV